MDMYLQLRIVMLLLFGSLTNWFLFNSASAQSFQSGFESPDLGTGGAAYKYRPAGSAWTFASSAGLAGNGSAFTNETGNAPEGDQVLFIQNTGAASKSLTVATNGLFVLELQAVQREQGGSINQQVISVSLDGNEIAQITPGATYQPVVIPLPLSAGSHTLTLSGLNPAVSDNTTFIDAVKAYQPSRWSDPATWAGNVPAHLANVTIPVGKTIILDTDVALKSLTVDGNLLCGNKDLNMSAQWIMVRGLFQCGSESAPYIHDLDITLRGKKDGENIMGMGDKFIGVAGNGALELHGETKKNWVKLGVQANVDDEWLTLARAVNWSVGDDIVITSNRLDPEEAEERTITAISTTGRIIRLSRPLAYPRMGQLKTYTRPTGGRTWNVDTRVEVGLLSRNITVQGDAYSETSGTGFGGHIMAMENGRISASGIELFRMGQRGELGRYPWHWHLLGEAGKGQYLKNSSIHHSYNRAIVIHGTWHTLVKGNVAYDHIGHGIMLEDGSEKFNLIQGNLALLTRRPAEADALTPSDFGPYRRRQNASPSTYWITNPNNIFIDNVAAGTEGTGFWFAFPTSPTGASASDPRFQSMQPHKEPLGRFDRNTVHSSFNGLDINDRLDADHAILANQSWQNSGQKIFNDLTFFSNRTGIYTGIGRVQEQVKYTGTRMSDNTTAIMFATPHVVEDSVIVSYDEPYPLNNNTSLYNLLTVYDGPARVYDTHIVGFDRDDTTLLKNNGAGEKRPNHKFSGITYDHTGLPRIHDDSSLNRTGQVFSSVIYDVDGTLTGRADSTLVLDHPFFNTPSDFKAPNWNVHHRTNEHTVLVTISGKPSATLTRLKAGEADEQFYLHKAELGENTQMPLMTSGEYKYRVKFTKLPGLANKQFTLGTVFPAVDGEAATMIFSELGRLNGLSISGAKAVGSFNAVKRSRSSAYHSNGTDLKVKLYANGSRQTYTVSWKGISAALPAQNTSNVIAEGGFESPNLRKSGSAYKYRPIGSAWTFAPGAGLAGNGSAFTHSTGDAPEGKQVLFIQNTGHAKRQFTVDDGEYELSLKAAQRNSNTQIVSVRVDGAEVMRVTPTAAYETAQELLTLTQGLHTLVFVGLNPNGGDNTAFIDDVQLVAVSPIQDG